MTVKIPSLEEKLAIARLKQGDLDGMEALVKRHQVRAVSAAYLIVRDPKIAEDIVQEAFLSAAEKIDQFDESRPFGPWFLRSVINASTKAVRKQKRFIPLDGTGDEETTKDEETEDEESGDTGGGDDDEDGGDDDEEEDEGEDEDEEEDEDEDEEEPSS